jgi:lactoylglutathione lyase
MTNLHHAAIWVSDLDSAADFWRQHFGAVVGELYESKRQKGFSSRFVTVGQGVRIELVTKPGLRASSIDGFGWAHIALSLGTAAAVDAAAERFAKVGLLHEGPRVTGDGYYEAVVRGPDGTLIELTI